MSSLKIENLYVSVDDKEIIKGLDLELKKGEIHVIMGPNGSGKSTLANVLMGHPKYKITKGKIILDDQDITDYSVTERARLGLFLSQQHPPEIPGVTVSNFLRVSSDSLNSKKNNPVKFYKDLLEKVKDIGIDKEFIKRYVNVGFSGGEKKQMEMFQLLTLNPKYAILDEIDSGLDIDALKMVSEGVNKFYSKDKGILLITHYNRILQYIKPEFVHIMKDGKIIESGGKELAIRIEKQGYK